VQIFTAAILMDIVFLKY